MKFSIATITTLATAVMGAAIPADVSAVHPEGSLVARATNGEFTYYTPGLGACGFTNGPNDLIAAIDRATFDANTPNGNPNKNKLCNKRIRARFNGKTVDVKVVDRCAGCKKGDLDFSPAAFQKLSPLGAGRIKGNWDWL